MAKKTEAQKQQDRANQKEANRLHRWLEDECLRLDAQGKGPTAEWRRKEAEFYDVAVKLPWWRKGWGKS